MLTQSATAVCEGPDVKDAMTSEPGALSVLTRIAEALERLSPTPSAFRLDGGQRFIWRPTTRRLEAAGRDAALPLDLLLGVEEQKAALLANTGAFAAGRNANHALLWGARGTGKSALVKAVAAATPGIVLVEAPAAALPDCPALIEALAGTSSRCVLFLDDLALEPGEAALRALKPALDGGLSAGADNVIVYATANRRHIVAGARADLRGDLRADPGAADAEQERLSLSDRFGLWLGFHPIDQDTYLSIVAAYVAHFAVPIDSQTLRAEALAWAMGRGARSGRTAWQFVTALRAGLQG